MELAAYVHGEMPTGNLVEVDFDEAEPFLRAEILGHGMTEHQANYALGEIKKLVEAGKAIITMDEASKVYVGIAQTAESA